MNNDLFIAAVCTTVGAALGWWRGFAFAAKLVRFGVNLESWTHYSEKEPFHTPPRLVDREVS